MQWVVDEMTTKIEEFTQKVDEFMTDQAIAHSLIHGDADTEVATESGLQPSITKAAQDKLNDPDYIAEIKQRWLKMTQVEYDALATKNADTVYFIVEAIS